MGTSPALIVDSGVLYGTADRSDTRHDACRELVATWRGELVVPAFVAAEADYLILSRLGVDAELAFLDDLWAAYRVDSLDAPGLRSAADLCRRHRDLELGLADASTVVLADRWSTTSLATFDERHFRAVSPLAGGSFRMLPDDAG